MKKYFIFLITLLSVTLFGCNEKVDANEYVSISSSGFNGLGYLIYDIDTEGNPNIDKIECLYDNDGELSNGDTIDVICRIFTTNEKGVVHMQEQIINYEVNNLKKTVSLDDLFDVKATGCNGFGSLSITPKVSEELINDIDLKIYWKESKNGSFDYHTDNSEEYQKQLKNGDYIFINIYPKNTAEFEDKYNFRLNEEQTSIYIDNLYDCARCYSELPDELIEKLGEIAEDELINYEDDDKDYRIELADSAFYCESVLYDGLISKNTLVYVFNARVNDDSSFYDNYFVAYFDNVVATVDYVDFVVSNKDEFMKIIKHDNLGIIRNTLESMVANTNLSFVWRSWYENESKGF